MVRCMKTKYGNDLKTGDFVILMCENCLELGFYLHRGKGESAQYYTFFDLVNWFELGADINKHPIAEYIRKPSECRIAKYSPGLLTEDYLKLYNKSINALRILKLRE